jgi:hypothetical protein
MILANSKGLIQNSQNQAQKFERYLGIAQLPALAETRPFNLKSLLERLGQHFSLDDQNGLLQLTNAVLRAESRFYRYEDLSPLDAHPRWSWLLLPHMAAFRFKVRPEALSEFESELMKAQIRWEGIGCLSQAALSQDRVAIHDHIMRIEDRLISTGLDRDWQESTGLASVSNRLKCLSQLN